MSMTAEMFSRFQSMGAVRDRAASWIDLDDFDPVLLLVFISLLTIGIIMVASLSASPMLMPWVWSSQAKLNPIAVPQMEPKIPIKSDSRIIAL